LLKPPPPASDAVRVSDASLPAATPADRTATVFPRGRAAEAQHFLRRVTFGPTRADVETLRRSGWRAWLETQLVPAKVADPLGDDVVARFPRLAWSIADARRNLEFGGWDVMMDLGYATLARQAWSSRQLLEVMTDFWSNHLNVTNPSSEVWDSRHDYDRLVRAHALGSFPDLLVASSRHPAMLAYLDNASSTKKAPNENYARELLELHSVGVGAGYSEAEVKAAARLLTGWRIDSAGAAVFDSRRHDAGAVTVLGWSAPAHSAADGPLWQERFLRALALHPLTAGHLARKLCVRLVSDDPPASLVDAVAAAYLSSGGSVPQVLRALLSSPQFWAAHGQKVRRPLEDIVATLRVLEVRPDAGRGVEGLHHLYWMSRDLGQRPLAWAPPNGYPDVAGAWQSAGGTLTSWNKHIELVAHWWPLEVRTPPPSALLPSPLPSTVGGLVDALSARLVFRRLPDVERNAVLRFTGRSETSALRTGDEWVTWRLYLLAALILDSPSHRLR
jgi:uncharacterized protein (DUF1800 family)